MKDCGMVDVSAEFKYWDPARVGTDGTRRVPDLLCTNPHTQVEYVVDARIFWNAMSVGANGYVSYTHAERYQQYRDKLGHYRELDHNDPERRKRYYARHGPSGDKNTAKYWSHKILW